MFDIMTNAENAIEAYNEALKVSSANIAGMNVTGFKKIDVSFQSIFEKVLRSGTAASFSDNLGGTNPLQLGQAMAESGSTVDFTDEGVIIFIT